MKQPFVQRVPGKGAREARAIRALLLVLCVLAPLRIQGAPSGPNATVTPPETREIVAEGRAAIGTGGVPGAREAAVAQALRSAVEQATGVLVSAHTLTSNYRLLQDEVTTRAEGFATLKEIVGERVERGEVRVTVRALVSLRPLARRLKALGLTRAWRVRVAPEGDEDVAACVALLERTLGDAGFVVVTRADDVDLLVQIMPRFTTVAETPLETAAGAMTLHSVRAEMTVRAVRADTEEVVAAFSASNVAPHIEATTARTVGGEKAASAVAPRLAEALMLLPAQASQPVTLVVAGLTRVADVGRLHDALRTLPGVRRVSRRSWEHGTATWEMDVTTDAVPLLGRSLEEDRSTRGFRIAVSSETRARIMAQAADPAR